MHGFIKRISRLQAFQYRLQLQQIKKKLRKEVAKLIKSKPYWNNYVQEILGSTDGFSKVSRFQIQIITEADKIIENKFSLLGGEVEYDKTINWHKDFKSGFEWPKSKFYLKQNQVDLNNNADVKVPRELSRSHHLILLGQAYLLTSNEKYAFSFKTQINDWIKENPLMYGINWGCNMDVAIRAANWIYAYNMFKESNTLDQEFLNVLSVSLFEHGWFIEKNLERSFKYNGNHFDANLAGLLIIGLLFKETNRGSKWLKYSIYALFDEIRKQIQPSGLEWENSTYYNRLVLEIFSYSIFLLKRNDIHIPVDIEYRLYKMFRFLLEIKLPDSTLPIFGDNDSSRFLPLDKIYRSDINYLMAVAAFYYNDSSFTTLDVLESSEVFFFLQAGKKITYPAINRINIEEINKSKILLDIGIVKITSEDLLIIVNNSSPGRYIDDPFSGGSHAHADLLSFVLIFSNQQIFIDPGSYIYTSDYKTRNVFRSTTMHNTLTVDNKSQFKIKDTNLFDYESKVKVENIEFYQTNEIVKYIGKHNGYDYIENGLIHQRSFELNNLTKTLIIVDSVVCKSSHNIKINYHLHPNIIAKPKKSGFLLFLNGEEIASLTFESITDYKTYTYDSSFSESYGVKTDNKVICLESNINKSAIFISIIEFGTNGFRN